LKDKQILADKHYETEKCETFRASKYTEYVMKYFYIDAKFKGKIKLSSSFLDSLPKKVAFYTTIQFAEQKEKLIKQIEDSGRKVSLLQTSHTWKPGQILGCNLEIVKEKVDGFVYVGDGDFHPTALVYNNKKSVFQYDPFAKTSRVITPEYVNKQRKRNQAAKTHFLTKNNIGVLISVKSGQNFTNRALKLRRLYPEKNFYFLASNNVGFQELENFPFIEVFVNTACPRIGLEDQKKFPKPVVNLADVEELVDNLSPGSKYPLTV